MVPLTSCSEVTSRMQLISNSTQDEARICVPDDEKLLNQTSGSSVEVFSAIYERKRPDILGLDKVGVCFLSSSRSTADETCYNSLYLSRLLFGLEVIGIHNTQRYEITSPSLPNSLVLQSLLTIWDRYFTDYPNGRMIQCCYGDGSVVVQHALKDSSHKGRVVVLGINTYTPIAHKCSYLYHSLGNLFAMPQGISLPFSPNSQSLFLRRLTDPVFVPCFLHVLYEIIEKIPPYVGSTSEVFPEVAAVLRLPVSLKNQSKISLLAEDAEQVETNEAELQWLMEGSRRAIQERDPWSEDRLDRCLNLSIICLRLVEYASVIWIKVQNNETTNSFVFMLSSVVFTYYCMLGLSELVLLQTDCSSGYRKVRSIALCIASLDEIATFFNFANNAYLAIKEGISSSVKNQVNIDRNYFTRLRILCYDSAWLLHRATHDGNRKFKRVLQRFGDRLLSKPELSQVGKGTEISCSQVNQLYCRYLKQKDIFVRSLTLGSLVMLAISLSLPDVVRGSTIDYISLAAKSVLSILYIVFAVYLFKK